MLGILNKLIRNVHRNAILIPYITKILRRLSRIQSLRYLFIVFFFLLLLLFFSTNIFLFRSPYIYNLRNVTFNPRFQNFSVGLRAHSNQSMLWLHSLSITIILYLQTGHVLDCSGSFQECLVDRILLEIS